MLQRQAQLRRLVLFANPTAGRGRAVKLARAVGELAGGLKFDVRYEFERPQQLTAQQLADVGPDDVVATVGGDGTLRSVAERVTALLPEDRWPAFGMLPMGTANLMSQHLGIERIRRRPEKLAAMLAGGQTRQIDAGDVNGKLFLMMVGVGLDADVVHALDAVRNGPITKLSYVLPTVRTFGRYTFEPVTVKVAGRVVFGPAPALVFVGNIAEYGTGFPVLHEARSDDRLLDLCVLPCHDRMALVQVALAQAMAEHANLPEAVYAKTSDLIEIEAARPMHFQIDGDPGGQTPAAVTLRNHGVRLLHP